MTNRSQQRGTSYESSLVPYLDQHFPGAHRLGKQGNKDKGDFWLPPEVPFILEAKNEASYAGKLAGWLKEADVEATNAGKPFGCVVHKRAKTTKPEEQYVCLTLGTLVGLVLHG